MKKTIVFCMLIIGTVITYSQDTVKSDPTTDDQITQVVNAVYDKTSEAISQLADALKVPAEHVYSILVKQQLTIAITNSLVIIFLIFVGFFAIQIAVRDWKNTNKSYNIINKEREGYKRYDLDDNWWVAAVIAGIIILLIAVIAFCCLSVDIVTGFTNPEYGAIREIMNMF